MSLLVSQKLFPIIIKYVEVPLKNGQSGTHVIKTEEDEKKYGNKIKELQTQWMQPSFKDSNNLIREATVYDTFKGERDIDPCLYRSLILEKFLKHWDITDEAGNSVPCTVENMGLLDVGVATALIEAFNGHNSPSEESLKN